jgi:hypothetical protein
MRTVALATPPLPLLVPDETFDAFSWCPSSILEWRSGDQPLELNALDDALPLRLAFVLRAPWSELPTERAWLHTGRTQANAIELDDEALALAPYAIDDATDLLWEHRRTPTTTFWLAADNVNALYWALHDWSHFHNHGPFSDRPSTELQCDAAALVWLWLNRNALGLPAAHWQHLRAAALDNHLRLRAAETHTRCPSPDVLADASLLHALAAALQGSGHGGRVHSRMQMPSSQ